ncbi:MAG: 30S ribosomal protein S6 [Ruminococcus sp.]|nr:30S ribosomal protein S6 [Ruminococcus sp.]
MAVKANYETVMVISMKQGEEGIQALIEKFKALIEKHATLQSVDEWGKRKLAYLINKESEGYYVLMNFESEANFPAELDRIYKITDGIMRSLIIRKDDDAEVKATDAKQEAPAAKEEPAVEAVETVEAVEAEAEAVVEATEE